MIDNCGPIVCAIIVVCNESDDGLVDGRTSPDREIVNAHHFQPRA